MVMRNGKTTREQLELATQNMRALAEELDKKPSLSEDDRIRLSEAGANVSALVKELGEVDPKNQVANSFHGVDVDTLTGTPSPRSADPNARALRNDLTALTFTDDQLHGLQQAALNRDTIAKASIAAADAPFSTQPDYITSVFPFLRDRVRLLDLIPKEPTNRSSVPYFYASTAATAAATVAPGANKPESSPEWTEATATVRKIAHYSRADDEVVADFSSFLKIWGEEMLAGLIEEETAQIAAGGGTGTDLSGLVTAAGLSVGSAGTDLDAVVDAWRAMRMGAAACDPDVVIMHPNDWFSTGFMLAKDSQGRYLVTNPLDGSQPRLFGLPVVVTPAMTENTLLVANLKVAATVYVRQSPIVEVRPGGGTAEFIANQTLMRAEERLALAVHHPAAVVKVTAV